MDKTLEVVLTFAGTAGGSAFLMYLFKGMGKWLSGAAHREQVKNTSLAKQRADAIAERIAAEKDRDDKVDKAELERDEADRRRREAEEHVGILQYQIRSLGHVPLERSPSNSK
jgi:hypothetical protein